MKKNVAVIGYGGMGGWHVEHLLKSDVANLAGIFDIKEERQQAARDKGCLLYTSASGLIGLSQAWAACLPPKRFPVAAC